ncbi:COX11 [Cordylochernes scorpioides]|uniref:COX11 n=1 Tax=Cordylochernes scorpioides TaxID=51811 RepID=A0ABY6LE29_9ARAC|nr:COX11 [Cordylochernes scorpioides]
MRTREIGDCDFSRADCGSSHGLQQVTPPWNSLQDPPFHQTSPASPQDPSSDFSGPPSNPPHPKSWVHATLYQKDVEIRNKIFRNYFLALILFMGGMSYAFVPLYNIFCRFCDTRLCCVSTEDSSVTPGFAVCPQRTGLGIQVTKDDASTRLMKLKKVEDRELLITFNTDTDSALDWNFKPSQSKLVVSVNETILSTL